MIALKERMSPPSWFAAAERATMGRWQVATSRRGLLVHDLCGLVVFVALVAAYLVWA